MTYHFYWPVLWQYRHLLWEGTLLTLQLFALCAVLSLVLGTIFGTMGASHRPGHRLMAEIYVELGRNVPIVVQLFFLYFALGLDAFSAAVIGLSVHESAYMAEIFRAGILSLPAGQLEAGLATGLSRAATFRYVILPQAFAIIVPPLTTQIIEVLKNSSIASTITITELTFQTQQIETLTFRGFEAATAVTLIYLFLSLCIAAIMHVIEWTIAHPVALRSLVRRLPAPGTAPNEV